MHSSTVKYEQIWYGFVETCSHSQHFFKPLFDNWSDAKIPIRVVGPFPETPPRDIRDRSYFWVSFSGEPFHQPTEPVGLYDAHLIMKPTDLTRRIIWMPLFSMYAYHYHCWKDLMIPRDYIPKTKFCATVVSNARGDVRTRFFDRLHTIKPIDSYGKWRNTMGYLLPYGDEYKCDTLTPYKFVMCFENTIQSHYMTEKLLHAYTCGAIPVYGGASIAPAILNPKAFLYLEEPTEAAMDALIEKMLALDQDDAAYRRMHAEPLLRNHCIPREMTLEYYKEHLQAFYAEKEKTISR